ncbi:MAG: hypothetical protein RL235_1193, partial [Chlamydiota bacterium]
LFTCGSLCADEPMTYWDYHPLRLGGNLIHIGKADVDGPGDGNLYFRKSNIYTTILIPVSQSSYFFPRVEWNTVTLDWNNNPKFNQTHYNYVQFGLTFYSTAIEQWRWILRFDYNIDAKHFSQPGPYGLASGLVWGAYHIHRKWHYHVGAMAYRGLEGESLFPIIGLDFAPNQKWLFEAIFPIAYSIQYKLNPDWRFSLKGRPLKERLRTGKDEPQPMSVFSYSTIGTELNVHFEKWRRIEIEVYAGYNFGGDFYIKSEGGHRPLYTTLDGAPYFGATLDFGF